MARQSVVSLFLIQVLLAFVGLTSFASAAPATGGAPPSTSASDYWFSSIKRQGAPAFHENGGDYKIFRNVKDFGAKGM